MPNRIPFCSMRRMPVGAELSEAREKLGLSIEDVAAQTKVKVERLGAIERMDIEGLPTLVYLKGFLRAYATAVQLDADAVTKRYLAELPSSFTAREANPPPLPTNTDLPLKATDVESAEMDDVPDLELPAPAAPRAMSEVGNHRPLSTRRRTVLPPAALTALRTTTASHAPMVLVAVIALMTGWVLGARFGAAPSPTQPAVTEDDTNSESGQSLAVALTPGTDVDIAPAVERAVNVEQPREPINAAGRDRSIDVSGSWAVTNRFDPARTGGDGSFNRGFRLQLQQRGNRVSGSGQQWMENGRSIPVHNRPSIRVEGTVRGRRLELNIVDDGARRSGAGKFVMDVSGEGTMRGRFVSDANARGMSLARRMNRGQDH
jgi:transcriptional regulator with XRE-family HTH domain